LSARQSLGCTEFWRKHENQQLSAIALVLTPPSSLPCTTRLGYGSSAIVYYAKYKPFNKEVAIKVIELDSFERNQIDELRVSPPARFSRHNSGAIWPRDEAFLTAWRCLPSFVLQKEIQVMHLSRHPNVLAIYGSFIHGSQLNIVMPFLSGGQLSFS
jgi:serine/threonine protein kinase